MEQQDHQHTPPDCFTLAELEVFQSFEGQVLTNVNYYLWINQSEQDNTAYRFLYFLELCFDNNEVLLLTSGEDSTSIQVSDAATLVKTAADLQALHGKIGIQRLPAAAFAVWEPIVNTPLQSINLSRSETGLYLNDALQLDFGTHQILVCLSETEGLAVGM